jgi:serine/threonine-protein kinase ULK2
MLPGNSPGGALASPIMQHQTHDIAMDEDDLPAEVVVMIAEEALVLLVHALGILTQINEIAENWVTTKKASSQALTSPRSMPANSSTSSQQVWWRVNSIVQWTTVRFNEGVERSELVSRKLQEAQRRLPSDHPAHPSNAVSMSALSITSTIGSSGSNVVFTTGVSAAKLMYDRALELSRMTAINELTKTDLSRGEIDYKTSIQLLEAILEDGEPDSLGIMPMKRDDAQIDGLDNEDRATIKASKCHCHS